MAEHHIARVLSLPLLDVEAIRRRAPVVALDCVHGAGGVVVPELLRRLGCRVEGIGLVTDGLFPRDPEPIPANLGELSRLVRSDRRRNRHGRRSRWRPTRSGGLVPAKRWERTGPWRSRPSTCWDVDREPLVTNLSSSQSIEDVAVRVGVPFHRAPGG